MANKDVGRAFDSVFDGQPTAPVVTDNREAINQMIDWVKANYGVYPYVETDGTVVVGSDPPPLTTATPSLPEHDRIRRDLETSLFGGWEPVELPIDPVELEKERVRMGHKNTYVAKAAPSPVQVVGSDPHPACRTCWGLGFVPGTSGRHVTCEDCGYDMVEFK